MENLSDISDIATDIAFLLMSAIFKLIVMKQL